MMLEKRAMLLVDGHVHIYPFYNLQHALQNGINNLRLASKKSSAFYLKRKENNSGFVFSIWLLAERADCNFFEDTVKSAGKIGNHAFKLFFDDKKETIIVEKAGKSVLYILPGRQIVTKEGLEILALASKLFLKDRENSSDDVIKNVIDSDGIAAINWAPGKWFFSRGKVVKRLLEEQSPENLLICDTSLRTSLWPTPRLMAQARRQGFKVIAGSDPLPFCGEEKYLGSYGFYVNGEFNLQRPADSIRSLLRKPGIITSLIGKRNGIATFCRRQYKILAAQRSKKRLKV
ncbi:MAG: hypothetical protein ACETWK_13300 [Candidatus Aminicenantaceae bacterium]